jgi:hypothetical protein
MSATEPLADPPTIMFEHIEAALGTLTSMRSGIVRDIH